jgi:zinc protease
MSARSCWRPSSRDGPQRADERARTRIEFTGPISLRWNEVLLDVLENVLDLRVIDVLRQRLGATYSPQAGAGSEELPEPTYDAFIDFVSDPNRVEELSQAVFTLIDELRTQGPSEVDVNKAKEQARLARRRAMEENSFWLAQLEDHLTIPGDDNDTAV